ncbi:MAG: CPBP family intramembrane glutamic endopeptidase [Candidatus Microgenomates bacterium]|jgi:membrane protease YdiL (CAAX protease family)
MKSKTTVIKNITIYSTYLIVVWAFYRFLFQLPDNIEELVVKPILWLVPIFIIMRKEGFGLSSLGITFKNFFSSVYLSVALGVIFLAEGLLTNFLKYGGFHFGANIGSTPLIITLGLSFATAISEETAFRGYIFGRLWFVLKNELSANTITTILWTAIHIPIAFFVLNYTLPQGIIYLILTAIFGFGSAYIFARTKNITGSILLHVLWEWPIILFR